MSETEIRTAFISAYDKAHCPELAHSLTEAGCEVFSYGGTLTEIQDAKVAAKKTYDIVPDGWTVEEMPSGLSQVTLKPENREAHARAIAERIDRTPAELDAAGVRSFDFVYMHPNPTKEDNGAQRILFAAARNQNCIVISSPPEALSMIQFVEKETISETSVLGFRGNVYLWLAEQFREAGNAAVLPVFDAR